MSSHVLAIDGLRVYRGGKRVLAIEKLTVSPGEVVTFIGPNGAGKSTLLLAINMLLPYQEGSLKLFGQEAAKANELALRRRCSLLFQEPMFLDDTVYNNVALPLTLRKIKGKEAEARVLRVLEITRCRHLAGRPAQRLSGGEAQRVNLARALVTGPELLLLDEPFGSLDMVTRRSLLAELRQILEDEAVTAIMVSHSMGDVLYLSKRTVVLQEGSVTQDSSPENILRRPANAEIARISGMDNILRCQTALLQQETWVSLTERIGFAVPGAVAAAYCCLPGDIFRLLSQNEMLAPGWVEVCGYTRHVIPGVGHYQAKVAIGDIEFTVRLPRDQAIMALAPGRTVRLAFHPSDVHLVAR
ncbi:MAG: ABC transporter ATP-binding protein [Negativicutes bacterium]|nr:ABC transporter ATP-binding protein [Negativicutes bacterium]